MIKNILSDHFVTHVSGAINTMNVYEYVSENDRATFTTFFDNYKEDGHISWNKYVTIYYRDIPITVLMSKVCAAFDAETDEEALNYLGEFLVGDEISCCLPEDDDPNSIENIKYKKALVTRLANIGIRYKW